MRCWRCDDRDEHDALGLCVRCRDELHEERAPLPPNGPLHATATDLDKIPPYVQPTRQRITKRASRHGSNQTDEITRGDTCMGEKPVIETANLRWCDVSTQAEIQTSHPSEHAIAIAMVRLFKEKAMIGGYYMQSVGQDSPLSDIRCNWMPAKRGANRATLQADLEAHGL